MAETLERRRFLKMSGGLAIAVGAKMLGISTAYAAQTVDCPVYLFHGIAVGGAVVDRVIRDNARSGRIPVSVKQLGEIILGEAKLPDRPLFCLTFDDSLKSQMDNAVPVLNRYGVNTTFFVIAGLMDETWTGDNGFHTYMKPEDVEYLNALGYEIGSHTVTHRNLGTRYALGDYGAIRDEIYQSKDKLEIVTQSEVSSFCYPDGTNNVYIRNIVAEANYKVAASTVNGRIQSLDVRYLLRRMRA